MKVVICLFVCLSVALAMPQKEGSAFTQDAIKQAQTSLLIPSGAKIENVSKILLTINIKSDHFHLRFKKESNLPLTRTFPEDKESTWLKFWALKFHKKSSQTFRDKSMALAAPKHF